MDENTVIINPSELVLIVEHDPGHIQFFEQQLQTMNEPPLYANTAKRAREIFLSDQHRLRTIFLNYDLSKKEDAENGADVASDFSVWRGRVIIHSESPEGRKRIVKILKNFRVSHQEIPLDVLKIIVGEPQVGGMGGCS